MPISDGGDGKVVHFPTGGSGRATLYAGILFVLILVVWLVVGGPVFVVEQDEQAVVLTFGCYSETAGPGLHFKAPWPVQTVVKEKVTHVRRIEVGFRTESPGGGGKPGQYRDFKRDPEMNAEAEMLTGDENIVNVEIVVQYEISQLRNWLFNCRDPERILRMASEAVLRQVVGDNGIDDILIQKRTELGLEMRDRLHKVAESYGLGVRVTNVQLQEALPPSEVSASFKEVATAKEESAKLMNQAMGYANEKKHSAGGQASRIRAQAEGYKAERVALAQGECERFKRLASEYKRNPDIMRDRLYLETLQRVLPKVKKVIVDRETGVVNMNRVNELPGGPAAVDGGR